MRIKVNAKPPTTFAIGFFIIPAVFSAAVLTNTTALRTDKAAKK